MTNDGEVVLEFEWGYTVVYYLSLLFPSFYHDKKEFFSSASSSFDLS